MNENHERAMSFVLRIGVAFVFVYPSIAAVQDPASWIGYFPMFLRNMIPMVPLSLSFAAFELILAVWIISGKKIFLPSVVASLLLISIVAFNIEKFPTLFRNVAILSATIALAIHSYSARHIYHAPDSSPKVF
jgi:hypothetical protein